MAIPNQTITNHHIGESKQEFKAGMRAEDFPHLANLLVNLYSDPVTAVIREYSTNALDSHIEAGVDRPIEVTLPSNNSLEFVVQDYGIGLSVDDLRDIYSMYGRSTKRDSNDAVGQLGLGCKSGLTYADAFTITAVRNGIKVVAMSTKDEHGVGVIKVLDTVSTTEPNGVRIAIPVKTWDVRDFQRSARELFQFWDEGTVLVNGEAPEVPEWRKAALALDDDTFVIPPNAGLYSSYVIMGNVAYEVPDAAYGPDHSRKHRRFVARLNMGDVDFVPSREAVHNTPHTEETLRELRDYIADNFDRVLNSQLSQCKTNWEETKLKVLWKGSSMRLRSTQDMPIWKYEPKAWGRKARGHTSYRIEYLTSPSTVIITNFPNKTLANAHRDRLTDMCPDTTQFIIVPSGTNVAGLDGRENVYKWDHVVGATKDAPKVKAKRSGKRAETRYNTTTGVSYTAAELAELDGPVLLTDSNRSLPYDIPGATIVRMYSSNQEPRLRRLVPGIKSYDEEVEARQKDARDAVTQADLDTYRAQHRARRMERHYLSLDPDKIDDHELADAIRTAGETTPASISHAASYGVTFVIDVPTESLTHKFNGRYPLIANRYGMRDVSEEEMIFYINAKYAAIQAESVEEESAA